MAWGQSIAQSVGRVGNEFGSAVDSNIQTALSVIQQKLMAQELQSRIREQDLRLKQMQQAQPQGAYSTPRGVFGATFDPNSGHYGGAIIPGSESALGNSPVASSALDPAMVEKFVSSLPPERQESARRIIPILSQLGVKPPDIGKFFMQEAEKETAPKPVKEAGRDDRYIAIQAKPKSQWTPDEQAFVKGYEKFVNATKVQPGVARMEVLMNAREYPTLSGGELKYETPAEIKASQKSGVGAAPGGLGVNALKAGSVFKDIHFNVEQTRAALNNLDSGFSPTQRAQMAYALKADDPHSAMQSFLRSQAGQELTDAQVNYITALASLSENAMALRGVAGMGQGSDDLRAAIRNAIPGAGTPTQKYGNRQLDLFEGTVNRLETAVPKIGGQGGEGGPPPGVVVRTYDPATGTVK